MFSNALLLQSEVTAKLQKDGKKFTSAQLAGANDEWKARQTAKQEEETARFKQIDVDGSGELDLQEIIAGASILNITAEEAEQIFKAIDTVCMLHKYKNSFSYYILTNKVCIVRMAEERRARRTIN